MTILITLLIILGVGFLCEAGLVWLVCWGLNALGIYTICGVAVSFSWPLVIVVWAVGAILQGIFKSTSKSKD